MTPRNKLVVVTSILLAVLIGVVVFVNNTNLKDLARSPFGEIPQIVQAEIPILMYHYVEYNQDERDFLRDQQNVPPNVLEQQILDLKQAGYTFITPNKIPALLKKNNELAKHVVLSFDDGFRDFYTDAFPILKKNNVSAINYIVLNFMGGSDYMTEEMVAEIAKSPLIEIGSHTLNHAYLLDIPEDAAWNEISSSKYALEQKFGVKVSSFAYPYGNYDSRAVFLVKNAKYETAVTVDQGNIVSSNNLYELKRIRPGHLTGQALIDYISQ